MQYVTTLSKVVVNVVICAGARGDIQDRDGYTPLQWATEEKVHVDAHI